MSTANVKQEKPVNIGHPSREDQQRRSNKRGSNLTLDARVRGGKAASAKATRDDRGAFKKANQDRIGAPS